MIYDKLKNMTDEEGIMKKSAGAQRSAGWIC